MISNRKKLKKIIENIDRIIKSIRSFEEKESGLLKKVHRKYTHSAKNLLHYRALRSKDLSKLQKLLGDMGLTRLSIAESHILASLLSTKQLVKLLLNEAGSEAFVTPELSIKKSRRLLTKHVKCLLGERPKRRRTRIMVTMPPEIATDQGLVLAMLEAGMNIARINCAHDTKETWHQMIENIRNASSVSKIPCLIAMDLGGPKIRTGAISPGPEIQKIRPEKNEKGEVISFARIWMGLQNTPKSQYFLPVTDHSLLQPGQILYFRDTRNKKRKITITEVHKEGLWAEVNKTTYFETDMIFYRDRKRKKKVLSIERLSALDGHIYLKTGDKLVLTANSVVSKKEYLLLRKSNQSVPVIQCTLPVVIGQVKKGEPVMFDDGKFEGEVIDTSRDHLLIKMTHVMGKGAKLKSDKGINFPKSNLKIRGLTNKDIIDLEFVLQHADIVNMSFVNTTKDVRLLLKTIDQLSDQRKPGIILKIETEKGFKNLTEILLTAMQVYPIGVMIARGDLALEVGWQKLAPIQREMMKLCRAADIPDVWATQVFESLAKDGIPSRAEMTDIWVAQRAECVMLNKGPYILDAVKMLDSILINLDGYHDKNAPMLPSIHKAFQK